jgi:hypothetical protein
MLPIRKSAPAPRAKIAAEVRVPSEGTWFAALIAGVRPDGLFLSTFQDLPSGIAVIVELSLPDGPVTIDGVVAHHEDDGPGVRVTFDAITEDVRARIEAALPPISGITSRVA